MNTRVFVAGIVISTLGVALVGAGLWNFNSPTYQCTEFSKYGDRYTDVNVTACLQAITVIIGGGVVLALGIVAVTRPSSAKAASPEALGPRAFLEVPPSDSRTSVLSIESRIGSD